MDAARHFAADRQAVRRPHSESLDEDVSGGAAEGASPPVYPCRQVHVEYDPPNPTLTLIGPNLDTLRPGEPRQKDGTHLT